jgi:hypothetical protein
VSEFRRCESCYYSRIQFGEYTGQSAYLRCTLSSLHCTAERQGGGVGKCGPMGANFIHVDGPEAKRLQVQREGDSA